MPPGPYAWDPTLPAGTVDNINVGDAAIRSVKSSLQTLATDWFHDWPTSARCKAGWPRVFVAVTKSVLPERVAPYGRLAYVQNVNRLYRETATGWVNAHPVSNEYLVATGLTGDGFVASPTLCGTQVFDDYAVSGPPRPTFRGIFVGRDFPCGADATYRGFFRWPLAGLPTTNITSVSLQLYLMEKVSPAGDLEVRRINDFGTLDAGDYGIATITNLGAFCTPSTPIGWVTKNVKTAYLAALGSGVFALQLRSLAEGTSPGGQGRFYGFVSADDTVTNPYFRPRLVVGFGS
jgi:hypothetical protein